MTDGFGSHTTALDVLGGVDLTGRRALVTGSTSGIGWETVRALAAAGAEVTMAARNAGVAESLAGSVPGTVHTVSLDLADQSSIEAVAEQWEGPLHLLINNAGVMAVPTLELVDGWETQFAVNHLGHFRLAVRLHQALRAAGGARVVSVSSSSHTQSPVVFDDVNFRFRPYDPFAAYAQAKTANVLFAVGAGMRWADDAIEAHAVMPGLIKTGIQRHLDAEVVAQAQVELAKTMAFKSPEQGAATSVFAGTSPSLDGAPASYLEDCQVAPVVEEGGLRGVAPYALDQANADRLWDVSMATLDRR